MWSQRIWCALLLTIAGQYVGCGGFSSPILSTQGAMIDNPATIGGVGDKLGGPTARNSFLFSIMHARVQGLYSMV